MGNKEWLCYRKSITSKTSTPDDEKKPSHPRYEHLRTVTVDADGYMSCTCGHVNQYMAPCIHIMAILDDQRYITADLFHLRWWKVYNYYFLTEHGRNLTPGIHASLLEALKIQSESSFDYRGVYRGCNLAGNGFLETVLELSDSESIEVRTAVALKKYISQDGPLRFGSSD